MQKLEASIWNRSAPEAKQWISESIDSKEHALLLASDSSPTPQSVLQFRVSFEDPNDSSGGRSANSVFHGNETPENLLQKERPALETLMSDTEERDFEIKKVEINLVHPVSEFIALPPKDHRDPHRQVFYHLGGLTRAEIDFAKKISRDFPDYPFTIKAITPARLVYSVSFKDGKEL